MVSDQSLRITNGPEVSHFLLLQGKPIDEPIAQYGPFVMNHQSEIQETMREYQLTQFGGWPWERDDMIFPQDKTRFALIEGYESFPVKDSDERQEEEAKNIEF